MLSQEEIGKIKAEIEYLEQAREASTDGRIRKQIEAWIEERRLVISDENPR